LKKKSSNNHRKIITTRPTIKDIAEEANLSPSTVSRALNDHPKISLETKDRVIKIANALGYTPNIMARSLVKRKSNLLGLVVYDFRNTFYADLTRVVQKTAHDLGGYRVIQASTDDNLENAVSLINTMIEIGVDGLILSASAQRDQLVKKLLNNGFPIVFANRRLEDKQGDFVVLDNVYGAFLLINHLIQMGNRNIAMIKGPSFASTATERYQGYLEALHENELLVDDKIIKEGSFTQDTGYEATMQLIDHATRPDAIFCCDDEIALGAMRALSEVGLKVPEDIALAGFDDAPISSHPLIQLTTVRQDVQRMGELCTRYLINRIKGKVDSPQQAVLEPQLIIRRTCGSKHGFLKK
jgi:DNA-binding LacI/PurR family transcriptional regulator